ncbi:MAG: hypothetical protein HY717_08600 [Planctomycetes bacterium]|nr:hypothetical protein [Planctomycetota bacterium]
MRALRKNLVVSWAWLVPIILGLVGCGGGFEFPVIEPQDQAVEMTFQRDRGLNALGQAVDGLTDSKTCLESASAQTTQVNKELEKERAAVQELSARIAAQAQEIKTLEEQVQNHKKELAKFKETRSKIEEMAQGTLSELSELRQKNESLATEKARLEKQATSQDQQIETMSRELDDLKAELTKIRIAFRALQDNTEVQGRKAAVSGDEVATLRQTSDALAQEKVRLEKLAAAQNQQLESFAKQVNQLRDELIKRGVAVPEVEAVVVPEALVVAKGESAPAFPAAASGAEQKAPASETASETAFQGVLRTLGGRLKKALHGNIAWDGFDLSAAAGFAGAAGASLAIFFLVRRSKKLSRRLAEVQSQYRASLSQLSQPSQVFQAPAQAAGAPDLLQAIEEEEEAPRAMASPTKSEIAQAVESLEDKSRVVKPKSPPVKPAAAAAQLPQPPHTQPSFRARRPAPPAENFGTIIRKSSAHKEAKEEAPAVKGAAEEAPVKSAAEPKPARRIIGALREEAVSSLRQDTEKAFLVPLGKMAPPKSSSEPAARAVKEERAVEDEENGGHTQIISDFDEDLFNPGGSKGASHAKPQDKTATINPGKPAAAAKASKPEPAGSSDEQELLKELKTIISKKFDQVK